MPTITATIDQVRVLKSGTDNGREWQLLGVDAGGKTYTTLDAAWREKIGQTVEIPYEVEQRGKYTNLKISKPKREGGGANQQVVALLTEIRDLLKAGRA